MTSRRQVLKAAAGLAGAVALPSALAACDAGVSTPAPRPVGSAPAASGSSSAVASQADTPKVTLAASVPMQDITAGFTAETGIDVLVNNVAGYRISAESDDYLGGSPEDVVMFLTGHQMRRAAAKGLLEPLDDVWAQVGSRFSQALKEASTGDDGRIYAIPYSHGPWAVFYRHSLFASHGYSIPTTWTEYLALAERMKGDGITPLSLGDLQGFSGLGLFDILNLRQNGYQFHVDLIAGRLPWTDPRVRDVFVRLRELLSTVGPNPGARSWEVAGTDLAERRAGMAYMATYITSAVPPDVLPDLGMFAFPALETEFDTEHSVEDPSDAFVMPRNAPTRGADADRARAFLEYVATPSVQRDVAAITAGPAGLPAVEMAAADRTPLQEEGLRLVAAAQHPTLFLDRDASFPSAMAFQDMLQAFVINPDQAIDPLLAKVQGTWDPSK